MPKAWIGTHSEAEIIRATVEGVQGDPLERRKWNVEGTIARPSADDFWKWLVLSLLSSQQRYSEGSAVSRLENDIDEFPVWTATIWIRTTGTSWWSWARSLACWAPSFARRRTASKTRPS
jgi:hypothetical protein